MNKMEIYFGEGLFAKNTIKKTPDQNDFRLLEISVCYSSSSAFIWKPFANA